jgi:cell fate (sporulation/competence/biofilm development) regulator YlbF (YheA/YmcA/DUF963 family)
MTDQEIYEKYLELKPKVENNELTKKAAAEIIGLGELSRPAEKLTRVIKKMESSVNHTTTHTPQKSIKNREVQEVTQNNTVHHYFKNEDNMKALIEIVENHKNKSLVMDEIEVLDINLPLEYRKIKNEQKSVRVNSAIWKDWEAALRKDHNLKDIPQSQLLNLSLVWAMKKIVEGQY